MIPEAALKSTRELKGAVFNIGDLGAVVEAALVQRVIPGASPVGGTGIFGGVSANATNAGVVACFPFASGIVEAVDIATVLRADIVLTRRNGVLNVEVVESGAENNVGACQVAVVALVGRVGFVAFGLATAEVGASFGVDADADFAVAAVLVAPAKKRIVSESLATSGFVVVQEGDGS